MNRQAFGHNLKKARVKQNFTSKLLGELCGMNAAYIRQIECGIKLPSLSNLVKLCNTLQVSPVFFLKDDLDLKENNDLEDIIKRMRNLSQRELNLIIPTISTLIEHLEKE